MFVSNSNFHTWLQRAINYSTLSIVVPSEASSLKLPLIVAENEKKICHLNRILFTSTPNDDENVERDNFLVEKRENWKHHDVGWRQAKSVQLCTVDRFLMNHWTISEKMKKVC